MNILPAVKRKSGNPASDRNRTGCVNTSDNILRSWKRKQDPSRLLLAARVSDVALELGPGGRQPARRSEMRAYASRTAKNPPAVPIWSADRSNEGQNGAEVHAVFFDAESGRFHDSGQMAQERVVDNQSESGFADFALADVPVAVKM